VEKKRRAGRPAEIIFSEPETRPSLFCPACRRALKFAQSTVGGVNPIEHWDQYLCTACQSVFEYRRRTKQLRHHVS
jgi:hypothetical protein